MSFALLGSIVGIIFLFIIVNAFKPCDSRDTECINKRKEKREKARKRQEEWDKPWFEKTPWQKTKYFVGTVFKWIVIIFIVIMVIVFLASIGPVGRAAMTWG